jgi:hypothetical protein
MHENSIIKLIKVVTDGGREIRMNNRGGEYDKAHDYFIFWGSYLFGETLLTV